MQVKKENLTDKLQTRHVATATDNLKKSIDDIGIDMIVSIDEKRFDVVKIPQNKSFLQYLGARANILAYIYNRSEHNMILSKQLCEHLKLSYDVDKIQKNFFKHLHADDKSNLIHLLVSAEQEPYADVRFSESPESKTIQTIRWFRPENMLEEGIFIGVVQDITEWINSKDKLILEKEKLEESDKIKTTFLINLSHEIRTPMNAIIGFTELLGIGELKESIRNEYFSIIKSKSKQLLSLLDDITELSKFESGLTTLNHTETNICKMLSELHAVYSKEIAQTNKHLDFYIKLPNDMSIATAYTDSGRLQQLLMYLIDNATKFTEKGYIQIGYDLKDSKNLLFFVKDTGIGIPKEAQKYLFNRFKVKDAAYDKQYSHSGLGLTIARSITELLGGKIWVDSAMGSGTTFFFTIPYVKNEKHGKSESDKEVITNRNWRNKVILVAEDDEVNFRFLEAVLAETHVQLLHVLDGAQAVEICNNIAKIDLILMDIRMPEISGFEAIKEIKAKRPDLPIIAQTAYTNKEDRDQCFSAGCNDYITKPIDIEELYQKIALVFTD